MGRRTSELLRRPDNGEVTAMEFRIDMKLEVEDEADELATRVPITVQVLYRGGRWQAQCLEPPVSTELCETMEEALIQAAKDAAKELASA